MVELRPEVVTAYPEVNELLDTLLAEMKAVLGERLVGLILFGSLAAGDFDDRTSDVDLIAAVTSELSDEEFERLDRMHEAVAAAHAQWRNRVEIGYLSRQSLQRPVAGCPIALISPGEPFHRKSAENDWVLNRHTAREKGVALYGPAPETLIDPIPKAVLDQALRALMGEWRKWISQLNSTPERNYQAYMILTMCRALMAHRTGSFTSKRQAALWAMAAAPAWSGLIERALVWRDQWQEEKVDHEATWGETMRFARQVIEWVEGADAATAGTGAAGQ